MKPDRDEWLNPAPPYDPIDWTDENSWRFLNGIVRIRQMTRAEFEAEFPSDPPVR